MKKLLLVSMVVLLVFALAAPVAAENEEFVLIGTDAAYADLHDGDCGVFVGYVWAKTLKYFDTPGVIHPHTDLDVFTYGSCDELGGTLGTLDNPDVGIVKLESAFVDSVTVPLGGTFTAVVDLEWTATGDVYKQTFHEPGQRANHRTRDANVDGTVVIYNGTTIWKTFNTNDHLVWSIITHYNEIVKGNLP